MKHKKVDPSARYVADAITAAAEPRRDRFTDREDRDRLPLTAALRVRFSVSEARSAAATAQRRTAPIMAYVGPNGGGKSLAMVKDTLPSLLAGRRVISTVRLIDVRTGEPFPSYEPFVHADQLIDARDCDILMDEMVGVANSREAGSLDVRVQNKLVQLRRADAVVRWSAPNYARADKIVREVTQAVTECRGYATDRRPQIDPKTGEKRLWQPKRLFSFRTYDTLDFEDWTAGKRDRLEPSVDEWFVGPNSLAFASYDTLDAVESVAGMTKGGTCIVCGGTVKRLSTCRCGDDAHDHRNGVRNRQPAPAPAKLDIPVIPAFSEVAVQTVRGTSA